MGNPSNSQSRSPQSHSFLRFHFLPFRLAKFGLGLCSIAVVVSAPAAMAQTTGQTTGQTATLRPTIPDQFEDAFFSNGDTIFGNQSLGGTLSLIFGIPGFPENQISRDGRNVNALYREVLEQQVASDPTIRTPDLPNPFSGSLLTTPLIAAEEPIPPAPPPVVFQQPNFVPAPAPAPAAPARPVPALW